MKRKVERFIRRLKPFDRRRFPRIKTHPPVQCIVRYLEKDEKKEGTVYINDVSRGGLLLSSNDKIYPQTQVMVLVQLPSRPQPLSIQGEVLRTYRRGLDDWYYSGVKFTRPQEEDVLLLLDFVAQLRKCAHP